jgi:hypothetical protein
MPKNSQPIDHFISTVVDKPQVFFASNQKIVDSALAMAKLFYDDGKIHYIVLSKTTKLIISF